MTNNTFQFKHIHKALKKVIYTATSLPEGLKVTWTDKKGEHETMYTYEEMEHAFKIGHWKVVK